MGGGSSPDPGQRGETTAPGIVRRVCSLWTRSITALSDGRETFGRVAMPRHIPGGESHVAYPHRAIGNLASPRLASLTGLPDCAGAPTANCKGLLGHSTSRLTQMDRQEKFSAIRFYSSREPWFSLAHLPEGQPETRSRPFDERRMKGAHPIERPAALETVRRSDMINGGKSLPQRRG